MIVCTEQRSGNDIRPMESPRREFIGDLPRGRYAAADGPPQVVARQVVLARRLIGRPDRDRAP